LPWAAPTVRLTRRPLNFSSTIIAANPQLHRLQHRNKKRGHTSLRHPPPSSPNRTTSRVHHLRIERNPDSATTASQWLTYPRTILSSFHCLSPVFPILSSVCLARCLQLSCHCHLSSLSSPFPLPSFLGPTLPEECLVHAAAIHRHRRYSSHKGHIASVRDFLLSAALAHLHACSPTVLFSMCAANKTKAGYKRWTIYIVI
jgi:hypothetical protein